MAVSATAGVAFSAHSENHTERQHVKAEMGGAAGRERNADGRCPPLCSTDVLQSLPRKACRLILVPFL